MFINAEAVEEDEEVGADVPVREVEVVGTKAGLVEEDEAVGVRARVVRLMRAVVEFEEEFNEDVVGEVSEELALGDVGVEGSMKKRIRKCSA